MTADGNPELLTVAEVANLLRVGRRTIERLIAAGELQKVKVGRSTRITVESYVAFIAKGGAGE